MKKLEGLAIDLMVLSGVGLIGYGSWLAWAPAGFVSTGVMVLALGISLARIRRPK